MAINRGPWNALIDDDGSGTTGSVWNKDAIKVVILDPIDLAAGGANTQVQFNDSGAWGGDSGLTYNKSTKVLSVGGDLVLGATGGIIRRNTVAGSDNGYLVLTAASGTDVTRSPYLAVYGNQVAGVGGNLRVGLGTLAGAGFEVMRGDGNPALRVRGSDGLVTLPYGQLQFPTTQVPSTDAYTFDDYRESAFTATDASGAGLTFSVNAGYYVKCARAVQCTLNITFPTTSNGAAVALGLPVTAGATGVTRYAAAIAYSDYTAGAFAAGVAAGTNVLQFFTFPGAVQLSNAQMSGKTIHVTAMYVTTN
jgi:hypothetical protein